jgi:hypothetical protein
LEVQTPIPLILRLCIGKVVKNLEYQCHDNEIMPPPSFKRARIREVSRFTFLPNSWWEYLDWVKEARTVVDQVTGGRSSPGM